MRRLFFAILFPALMIAGLPARALAHCDGMDGPVVKAAQRALAEGIVAHVLVWVQPTDEPAIKAAFEQTLAVRVLSPAARDLADRFFFETVVRLHRAGEGAPFTGLQPAGRDLGPAIPAADRALETGSADALLALVQKAVREGLEKEFHEVLERKNFPVANVDAGREYVKAYVEYVLYVERLYASTTTTAHGHFETERQ